MGELCRRPPSLPPLNSSHVRGTHVLAEEVPAVQKRVVAFAPFIEGMALRQLELVVAQPVEPEAAVVLLASRLVHRRIIGRVSFKRLALRFA